MMPMESSTFEERLQLLRDRYVIMLGPLVMVLAMGLKSSPLLAWTAGIILLGMTVNKLLPLKR